MSFAKYSLYAFVLVTIYVVFVFFALSIKDLVVYFNTKDFSCLIDLLSHCSRLMISMALGVFLTSILYLLIKIHEKLYENDQNNNKKKKLH